MVSIPFHHETHLGNKKGSFHGAVKLPLVGKMLKWRWKKPASFRYVVFWEKACFHTKTSLSYIPLVEISGIEPLTSLNAIQALSQLSYTPTGTRFSNRREL